MNKRSSRLTIVVTTRRDSQFGRLLIVGAVILAASHATPVWAQHPSPTGRQEKPGSPPEAQRPLRQQPDDADGVAGDGRRTLARLPQNVARGIGGVFSFDSLLPVLVGLAATGAARGFDDHLAFPDGANSDFGELGNGFGNPVFVAAAATGLLLGGRATSAGRFRDASYDLFTATAVTLLYTETLKRTIDRTRPSGTDNKSFPSGHTSNAFTWATVIDHHYGKKLGLPMYAFATLVTGSRIHRGSHFLSDVVAGAAVGFIAGRSVVRTAGEPLGGRRVTLVPAVGPSGQRGMVVVVAF